MEPSQDTAPAKTWAASQLFVGKPELYKQYQALEQRITALGPTTKIVTKTQVSFGASRKFAWLWCAPTTKKLPEGRLMLTLDMTRKVEHPAITNATETYPGKWTHQIPITDESVLGIIDAQGWLVEARKFGTK